MNNKEIKEKMDRSFGLGQAEMAGVIFLTLSILFTFLNISIDYAGKIIITLMAITGMILMIIAKMLYKNMIKGTVEFVVKGWGLPFIGIS